MQRIICECNGIELEFSSKSKYKLLMHSGIAESAFNVYTSKIALQHGEFLDGVWAKKRNPVISVELSSENYSVERDILYNFFSPNAIGTLTFEENGRRLQLEYVPENIRTDPEGIYRVVTLSLIATRPQFLGDKESYSTAGTIGVTGFEWPIEPSWYDVKFDLGVIQGVTDLLEVPNLSSSPLPMTAIINNRSGETITKPRIVEVDAAGNEIDFFAHNAILAPGKSLIVTTYQDNKSVVVDGNNVNYDIVPGSHFLQVRSGGSLYKFVCGNNQSTPRNSDYSLTVEVQKQYWGA